MQQPSNNYWSSRADARMAVYHRSADSTVEVITAAYDKGIQNINGEINKIFDTYAKNGVLTTEEAAKLLNEPINQAEWNAIKSKIGQIKDPLIKRRMLNQLNAPAYAARITRLQALKANTYVQSKVIADAEIRASTSGYMGTINDSYYRTMFDLQQGLGVGFTFAAMPTRTLETILKRPWSGRHYSSRVWDNTDVLADQLNEVITAGFMSGAGTGKMARDLMERMDVGKHVANRLVRTETTYMANAAEMESYDEAEINKYQFLATLDNRTSPQCQEHDGKVFNVKDAEPGKNMPPLHAYCRSTTIAYFGPETRANIQRRARDPVTGKNELVPADMTYEEWRKGLGEKYNNGLDNGNKNLQTSGTVKDHASKGDFTNPKNPTKQVIGKFKNGGHGQENINLLEKYGIQYNVLKEYPNGVRIGNVPEHKDKLKQSGTKQTWFPKNWSDGDIKKAGDYVANLKDQSKYILEPKRSNDELIAAFKYANYKGVTVGICYDVKRGRITTIFPDETQRMLGGGGK